MRKIATLILTIIFLSLAAIGISISTAAATLISFPEAEPNSTPAFADPIANSYYVIAELPRGDLDYFSFTVTETSLVTYDGTSDGVNLFVALQNSSNQNIMIVHPDSDGSFYLSVAVEPGNYFAYFNHANNVYSDLCYSFALSITPHTHTYDNTCDVYCNTCNGRRNPPHSFSGRDDTICDICEKTCTHTFSNACDTECNKCKGFFTAEHDYTPVTCTTPKKCKICGDVSENALGHTYSKACDTDCNRCGEIRTVPHNFTISTIKKSATCFTTGIKTYTCRLCKATKDETIPKLSHTYTNSCDSTCNNCGTKRNAGHVYTNSCDTACNNCYAARSGGHKYKTVVKKATVSADGYTLQRCTACGREYGKKTFYKASTVQLSATSYVYDGKAKKPTVTVKNSKGNVIPASSYTVNYPQGRTNAGTYKVTIEFKGDYSGTKNLTFKITPASFLRAKSSLSTTSYVYDGKAKKPTVSVTGIDGKALKSGTDYSVTYPMGCKNVGTYKVSVKFKGNYTGTKTLTFRIDPQKTSLSKLTSDTKSITITIKKKSAQVTGYQVMICQNPKFTGAMTANLSSYNTTKLTVKGLSSKKTYYVKVRTYKKVGNDVYYSGWSPYGTVKTK